MGLFDLDDLDLPSYSDTDKLIFEPETTAQWGEHLPSRAIVENEIDRTDSLEEFLRTLVGSLELAKSILAVPDSLPIISLRYSLSESDQKLISALSIGVLCHWIEFHREPSCLHVVDKIVALLGASNQNQITAKSMEIIDRAQKRTMDDDVGKMSVRNNPSQGDPIWMMTDGRDEGEKRVLYFSTEANSDDMTRAIVVGLYGVHPNLATRILSGNAETSSSSEFSEHMSRVRLLLAAGSFPEPATWGENRI